jgi:protein-S-isoprenylcysteine O-methyltransferase Ste14
MVRIHTVRLNKRGLRILYYGVTHKSDFLMLPFLMLVFYVLLSRVVGLPFPQLLVRSLWYSPPIAWVGLIVCIFATSGLARTLHCFGDSFRIGIDYFNPDDLVTGGVFAISRNPTFVCFIIFFVGLFLVHANIAIGVALVVFAAVIHRQVLMEEKFLSAHYGAAYDSYKRSVRRYL